MWTDMFAKVVLAAVGRKKLRVARSLSEEICEEVITVAFL